MINNSIQNIGLSVRAYNCLKTAGVNTIEEMALIDLSSLRNCGRKTVKEIEFKIEQLKEDGMYSQEFISQHLSNNNTRYIDSLPLSVRSKNILKNMNITDENDLLALDPVMLKSERNAGALSIDEILSFIESNRNDIEKAAASKGNIIYSTPINSIPNFSGNILIEQLPMNISLKEILKSNNIVTIMDLLLNKLELDEPMKSIYNSVYEYFYNIAYGPLTLSLSSDLSDLYVNLPFSLLNLNNDYYIKIKDLIEYTIDNFGDFDLEDKLNSKLFLYWINSFDIIDKKKYFVDMLKLNEKEFDILSLRGTHTLVEVGQIYNVTRERIRQIEAKAIKKINSNYKYIPFKFLDNKRIYYINEIDNFYSLLLYINTIRENSSHILIKNESASYYLPLFYVNKLNEYVHSNITVLESNGYIELDLSEWNDNDLLVKVATYLNLNINNNLLSRKLNKRQQVKYAMKYINKPISISSNADQEELVSVLKKLFGSDYETGRALEVIIIDAGIRVDSGKYAAADNVETLSNDTINKIVEYIKEREIINSRDLFIEFGDELNEHNLNNETILYRYLKDIQPKGLYFHGVSGVISSNPELSGWGDLAIRIMKQTNKPINKLSFIVDYSITDPVYYALPINYDDIIVWSNKELYLKSLLSMPASIKEELKSYIKEKQIVRFDEVRMIINRLDINLLSLNNVKSNDNLYNYLYYFFDEEFDIDKNSEEIRYKNKKNTIIEETYKKSEELTL